MTTASICCREWRGRWYARCHARMYLTTNGIWQAVKGMRCDHISGPGTKDYRREQALNRRLEFRILHFANQW